MTKDDFHRKLKTVLKGIARDLGLSDFEVRSNKGGPAVLGEVTLHASNLYLMVGGSCCEADNPDVMYRSCQGRKDYTGGRNQWMTFREFMGDREEVLDKLRRTMALSARMQSA